MEKKLFAVVGNPISHSKSPDIFSFLFKKLKINATYTKLQFNTSEDVIKYFRENKLSGINVTSPFKENIIKNIEILDKNAKNIESVNTIICENEKLKGYNTDYLGIIKSLEKNNVKLKNTNCLIIGAGGTAKAALYALKNKQANITITNRSLIKANILAKKHNCKIDFFENIENLISENTLIINTLDSNKYLINLNLLQNYHTVFDVNYKSLHFENASKLKNFTLISGKELLIRQALESFEIFTNIKIDKEIMFKSINDKILINHDKYLKKTDQIRNDKPIWNMC